MAHYAFINENNIVVEVITGRNEDEIVDGITDWETYYSQVRGLRCLRTSYTSRGGNRVDVETGETIPDSDHFRYNFAGFGYYYDEVKDAFIPPKPNGDNWELNPNTCLWEAVE